MDEVILFGDIEAALIAYLRTELATRGDTAEVHGDGFRPSSSQKRPDRLVVVKRLGGVKRNLVTDGANIDIHCYDPDDPRALAETVRGIIHATRGETVGGLLIHRIDEYSGPSKVPNMPSANPRYTFAMTIQYRGSAES